MGRVINIFLLLMLLGVVAAVLMAAPFFEAADNMLIHAGASFDGDPPPCRADRVGVVLTLKGVPSVCQLTPNGYEWRPVR
jgi:hypothetical protein